MKKALSVIIMLIVAFAPFCFVEFDNSTIEVPSENDAVQKRRVRIVAGGDFMQHTPQLRAARTADGGYDYAPSLKYVAPWFRDADVAIINLETTLSQQGPYAGYPCFCSPAEVGVALCDMGIDIVAMANNHCCDKGARGIRATTSIIDSLGMRRVGVWRDSIDYKENKICYLNRNNISFAIVNYTYGTNGLPVPRGCHVAHLDTLAMAQDFARIERDSVDCVVAIVHWGAEYQLKPNSTQFRLEAFMKRHGVDVIIGSHPHVVQPYKCDSINGVTIYSLGNFVSNQRKPHCDGGLVAMIEIEQSETGELRYALNVEPVWVQLPGYTLLPREVGDTLKMSAADRAAYERFMNSHS